MKAQDTRIWKQVEACKDLGRFKPNDIARNLQQVIDDPRMSFRDDNLMVAFFWEGTDAGSKYWCDLYDVLYPTGEQW